MGELNKTLGPVLHKGVSQTGGKGDLADRVTAIQSLGELTLKVNSCLPIE